MLPRALLPCHANEQSKLPLPCMAHAVPAGCPILFMMLSYKLVDACGYMSMWLTSLLVVKYLARIPGYLLVSKADWSSLR